LKKLLLLAYYFPPIGGAGSQRPAKFVRYLPEFGVQPIVVTGQGGSIGRWTPADETLNNDIPAGTEILRVEAEEPAETPAWRSRAERWLGLRTKWSQWWVNGTLDLGRRVDGVDAIYAWMSPYESATAAARLAVEVGKPWIADLGDPWALDEMRVYPTALHRRAELHRMRELLGSAAAIVMSTPEAVIRLKEAFPELVGKPTVAIPNGFDSTDFNRPPLERTDDVFRIVHTGYLHTELGRQQHRTASIRRLLGGEPREVDIYTRSHVYLLEAIERLIERKPGLAGRIEVHLAGVLSQADEEIASSSRVVRIHGYLPHADSIRLIRSADLLFLPMQNLPVGARSSTVPGKTYEYLASGRPILAAVPDGDAADLILEGGGDVYRPDDIEGMARVIDRRMSAEPADASEQFDTTRFEYRQLSQSVAEVVRGAIALREPPATLPAPSPVPARREAFAHAAPRALHLAYYFPPIGGAGAQRSLKFVRYLPLFGYESIVLTGPGDTPGRWTPSDSTLNVEVAPGTEILRAAGPEPAQADGWRGRAERWLGLESKWARWWITSTQEIAADLSDVDVIVASMSPYESAEAAERLSRHLGKPWVAGLRDPWALDEMMVFPTALHRRRELRRMRNVLSSAAAIVVTTSEAVVRLREAFPELATTPIVSIPNGFDASDFDDAVPERADDAFRIVHTGYLHTELGRSQRRLASVRRIVGGSTNGVDLLTRSHVYLLEALERLFAETPSLRDRIEVHLAGVLSGADRTVADRSHVVRTHGYLSHADSIRLIRSADLLFLPMQNLPAGLRSTTTPGKTYEYLAAGRPVLAAIPPGDARDILAAAGVARFARPDDSRGIAAGIAAEIARWESGEAPPRPPADLIARFERRHLTRELAMVLDAVIGPPSPGRQRRPSVAAWDATVSAGRAETYAT
jgi:glycosyltransferase involved in cell wall biosynthesis